MGKDYWWTAPAEADNGNTIIVTGHDNLDKYIDSGKYDSRVEIVWNYPALPSGMPEPDAEEIMEKVTEALQLPLKKERAIVMTGILYGRREKRMDILHKKPSYLLILSEPRS